MGPATVHVGLVGCGAISHQYVLGIRDLPGLSIAACADVDVTRAQAWARSYDVGRAGTVDELLAMDDIEIVVNLTVPKAHHAVAAAAIAAGKSVYNEKPLAAQRGEGLDLLRLASEAGVLIGGAPDTFLGRSLQTCRRLVDDGAIGEPVGATLSFLGSGHEAWHPSPGFYYEPGGGPLMDMGPYYLTALVALLGPVLKASGYGRTTSAERTIASGPDAGSTVPVSVNTHLVGALELASGAIAGLSMSFDVLGGNPPSAVFGTEGTIMLPDPNQFDAPASLYRRGAEGFEDVVADGQHAARRGIGVGDMARALRTGAPLRASGELSFHVLDVMSSFLDATSSGLPARIQSTCGRPPPFDLAELHSDLANLS